MKSFKLIILLSLFVHVSFAQVSREELDEQYTPPASSLFDSDANDDDKGPLEMITPTHEVNFHVLHLLRSKLNFEYRYNFSDVFSVGMGAGINLDQDYLLSFYAMAENILELDDDYSVWQVLNRGTFKSGFNINPSIRISYESWYFDDAFFQFDYRYDFNRYHINDDSEGFRLKTNLYTNSFNLITGVKGVMEVTEKFSLIHTLYYGVGGRMYNTYGLTSLTSDSPWISTDPDLLQFSSDPPEKAQAISFTLIIGYAVGLGIN